MPLHFRSLKLTGKLPLLFFILIIACTPAAFAQFYKLKVSVPSFQSVAGQQNVAIPIFMSNYLDTVAAYELTFVTDQPDLIRFNSDYVDTSGTLTSGWQYVSVDTAYETGLEIRAMANMVYDPIVHGIGYPQTGQIPLVKILVDVGSMPDSISSYFANIEIMANVYDFCFSDEEGQTIGLEHEFYYDTLWYNCNEWLDDTVCNDWEEVTGPPADTMVIDSLHPYLDTTQVGINNGSIQVVKNCMGSAGDADCSGSLNLLDAVSVISYLYKNGASPVCRADCNCDCVINILDISCLISYLYGVGSECNCCSCSEWDASCL